MFKFMGRPPLSHVGSQHRLHQRISPFCLKYRRPQFVNLARILDLSEFFDDAGKGDQRQRSQLFDQSVAQINGHRRPVNSDLIQPELGELLSQKLNHDQPSRSNDSRDRRAFGLKLSFKPAVAENR